MSIEQARAFLNKVHTDPKVRQKAHDAAEKIVESAKAEGFDCTREEISAALKEHWQSGGGKDEGGYECCAKFSEAPCF